ncbi:MAG: DUF1048 domain-containing protein [Micrococcales bacterium]|nr:DUF1048 domain-containing protein [Micrococcales bacterium]
MAQSPAGGLKPVKPSAWWNPVYGKYREEKLAWREHQRRVGALPDDYRWVMKQIERFVWNIAGDAGAIAGLDGILGLFEEGAAAGRTAIDVTGDDVASFALDVLAAFGASGWAGKTSEAFNEEVHDLVASGEKAGPTGPAAVVHAGDPGEDDETSGGFGPVTKLRDDKREWRRQMARVAALPADYQAVYGKIQHYMWARAAGSGYDILRIQYDLVDEFEAGALAGQRVWEITGDDVAGYCDEILRTARTFTDAKRVVLNRRVAKRLGTRSAS